MGRSQPASTQFSLDILVPASDRRGTAWPRLEAGIFLEPLFEVPPAGDRGMDRAADFPGGQTYFVAVSAMWRTLCRRNFAATRDELLGTASAGMRALPNGEAR